MAGSSGKSDLKVYLRLLRYALPYWAYFALSIVGFAFFASSQPMLAHMLKYFLDGLQSPDQPGLLGISLMYGVPLTIVLIALYQGIASFLGNYYLAKVARGVVHDLRCALFDSLLTLPNHYYDHHNSGHLISRITFNVTMVTTAVTDAIKVVIREGLTVIFLTGYLLWMNWKLTLMLLVILPLIALMVSLASKKFRKQSKKIQEAMGNVTHVASEAIQGYRVVRSFGGEAFEQKRFHRASADNMRKSMAMTRTQAIYTPTLQLIIYSGMAMLMYMVLFLRGDSSAGELIAYITAAGLLPKPIRQLSEVSPNIQKGLAAADSIFGQLDEPTQVDRGSVEKTAIEGQLDIRNLSFRYPGSEQIVLKDINITVAPGQMVALVGRSGSGKSTLANLIPRFYHHDEGQILIDGVDVEDYTLRNLRRHIALVTQQVSLFNDSIANNIAYGDLNGSPQEQIEQAAEAAYAAEFINRLPEGYATLIGENGVLLSGGQRQRLAIARAILKDAPILILDEATSALDTESERHIQAALEHATANRTTIVIAHRLSTIEKADLILVMDQGRIVERGTHTELLALNGQYTRLHAMQFSDQEVAS